MAVTLLLGVGAGYWLDKRFGTTPWCTLGGSVFGIIVGLYNFLARFLKK